MCTCVTGGKRLYTCVTVGDRSVYMYRSKGEIVYLCHSRENVCVRVSEEGRDVCNCVTVGERCV